MNSALFHDPYSLRFDELFDLLSGFEESEGRYLEQIKIVRREE